ncbi:MAG: beta-propeller fold lactonase family protein [Planctomycetaceae bacterium]
MRSALTVFLTTVCASSWLIAAEPANTSRGTSIAFKPFIAYGASATSQEIVAVRFDHADNQLVTRIVQREPLGFEGAPVIFRDQVLYVASLRAKEANGNRLLAFRVNNGRLTRAKEFRMQHGSAYISLDRSGQFLLGVSYFEGHADVYRLDKNGLPDKRVASVFEGRNKAHSILTSPDNRFVYIPYVGENNAMFQYAFNEKTGRLRPLDPPQAQIPDGIGPRHVAFHPTRPFVFFSNEQQLGATSFRMARDGQLKLITVCEPGTLKPAQGIAASDIEITPDGQFLFVGVRDFANGQADAIHRYAVGPNGQLTHLGKTDADTIPWGLQVAPDQRHLLVTAAHGETLTAFRIDGEGGLHKAASIKWGKMVRDIAVVVLPADSDKSFSVKSFECRTPK